MKRYETGTKQQVLKQMAFYAIQNAEALIDAYTDDLEPEEASKLIDGYEAFIRDFRRVLETL